MPAAKPIAKRVIVGVPHRISGFFEIVDHKLPLQYSINDLLSIGSRGGGPCLSEKGLTTMEIDDKKKPGTISILINGADYSSKAKTTLSVVKWMGIDVAKDHAITIRHDIPLLMGAGFGSSGSGALGAAIAVNVMFDLGMSLNECGKYAHCAEVENKTGLGTIGGQLRGGCTISMTPGFPFNMASIIIPPETKIACATRGGLSTAQMLSDPPIRKSIIESGKVAMVSISERFTIERFLRTAIAFVNGTWMQFIEQLDLGVVKNLMATINNDTRRPAGVFGASMNQMGKSVYVIYKSSVDAEDYIEKAYLDCGFDDVKFMDIDCSGSSVHRIDPIEK
jgi:pantoate kinase